MAKLPPKYPTAAGTSTSAEAQETLFDHDWMLEPFAHLDGGLASRLADLSRIASAVDAIARVLEGSAVQNDFDGGQGLSGCTLGGLHSALVVLSSAADQAIVGLSQALGPGQGGGYAA